MHKGIRRHILVLCPCWYLRFHKPIWLQAGWSSSLLDVNTGSLAAAVLLRSTSHLGFSIFTGRPEGSRLPASRRPALTLNAQGMLCPRAPSRLSSCAQHHPAPALHADYRKSRAPQTSPDIYSALVARPFSDT